MIKLDELIRSIKEARNSPVDLEDLTDDELRQLQTEFERLRRESANRGDDEARAERAP